MIGQLTPAQEKYQEVKRAVFAAMETGNITKARTELREYEDTNPTEARTLRADVTAAYGTGL